MPRFAPLLALTLALPCVVYAQEAAAPKPLRERDLRALLELGVDDAEVARLIGERGVRLEAAPAKDLGGKLGPSARAALKTALASATPPKPTPPKPTPPKPTPPKLTPPKPTPPRKPAPKRFVHSTYAFALDVPPTWELHSRLKLDGLRVDLGKPERAMTVVVRPIDDPAVYDYGALLTVLGRAYGGPVDSKKVVQRRCGRTLLLGLEGSNTFATGERGYQVWVGVSDEALFVINCDSPKAEWAQAKGEFGQVLRTLAIPAHPAVRRLPGAPRLRADATDRKIVKTLLPSVVLIHVYDEVKKEGEKTKVRKTSWGTGFVVHPAGFVFTNRHVVQQGEVGSSSRRLRDRFVLTWDQELNRKPARAILVGVSERYDIACLKITDKGTFQPVPFADVRRARSGDRGLVLGFPRPDKLGELRMSANAGSITAIDTDPQRRILWIRHAIQTDQGNSGGPLVDKDLGGVVGLHTQAVMAVRSGLNTPHVTARRAVPIHQAIREFPQIVVDPGRRFTTEEREQRASFFFHQRRWGSAQLEALYLVNADPKSRLGHLYLARIAHEQGEPAESRARLKTLLKLHGDDPYALRHALTIALDMEAHELSGILALALEKVAVNDWKALRLCARARLLKGDFARALALVASAEELSKGLNADLPLLACRILWAQGAAEGKLGRRQRKTWLADSLRPKLSARVKRSLELQPRRNGQAMFWQARIALYSGELNEAVKLLNRGLKEEPRNVELLLAAAEVQIQEFNLAESGARLAAKSIDLRPSAAGFYWYGMGHMRLCMKEKDVATRKKRFGIATSGFVACLKTQPKGKLAADCFYRLGLLHNRMGQKAEAKGLWSKCLELNPKHELAKRSLAVLGGR